MEKLKHILKKMFCLSPALTLCTAVPGFAAVLAVFAFGLQESVWGYISYPVSAYGLVICVAGAPDMAREVRDWLEHHPWKRKIMSHPLGELFLKDIFFRASISMYPGLAANLSYAGFKMWTAVRFHSLWTGSVAAYYMVLCIIRFYLILGARKASSFREDGQRQRYELQIYRRMGGMLFLLNAVMVNMILQMIRDNKSYDYPGYIIYISALYAFCSLTAAVVNLIKFRKKNRPVFSASKLLSFSGALMSILALQTAMISRFGADKARFRLFMNTAVGSGVSLTVLAMAVYMMIHSSRSIKKTGGFD